MITACLRPLSRVAVLAARAYRYAASMTGRATSVKVVAVRAGLSQRRMIPFAIRVAPGALGPLVGFGVPVLEHGRRDRPHRLPQLRLGAHLQVGDPRSLARGAPVIVPRVRRATPSSERQWPKDANVPSVRAVVLGASRWAFRRMMTRICRQRPRNG